MSTLLQINTNIGWNSVGRIAEKIGEAAINSGWESYIAYGRRLGDESQCASHTIRIGNTLEQWGHGLITRLYDRHGQGSKAATRDLIRHIEEIGPDVIHLHNIHGYYLNYSLLFDFLRHASTPVVWTLHDCWPMTGHCAFFDVCDCTRWTTGCHSCPLKKTYPRTLYRDASASNYLHKKECFASVPNLHIVAVSRWIDEAIAKSFLSQYPRRVIYNGIDLSAIPTPREKTANPHPIVLAAASAWESRKGLDDILRLRELLPQDIEICIVGLTERRIKTLPTGIIGMTRISSPDRLYEMYRRVDVFISTSQAESFSIVNIEAQACGTPVVCYDSGGMPETVSDRSGRVVAKGDVQAMARAVLEIINSGSMAEDCRNHILTNFDAEKSYLKYVDLYNRISTHSPCR